MGTSASSTGPGAGVPLVPPWVPAVGQEDPAPQPEPTSSPEVAPPARFATARRRLGAFARSGDHNDLRRALGSYTHKGLGGSRTASRRMAGAASRNVELFSTLGGLRHGTFDRAELGLASSDLAGLTAHDVIHRISAHVSQNDGTQDREASQKAITSSLSELLDAFPDANLLALTEEQIDFALERHLAHEVFRRIDLDIGKTLRARATTAPLAVTRLNEMLDYVRASVSTIFRKQRGTSRLTKRDATRLATIVIQDTYVVFEGYL